jgi:2-methylcitrate dehydratase PrpD
MVESGFTAVDDIFSGEHNFFQAFSPKADPKGLIAKLGQRYEITRTNIKKYAVGSPVQAPLDSLDYLLKQQRIRADEIATISVRVAEREARVVDNRTMPDICLQHLMAVMLVDGALGFAAAHDYDRMRDPKVLAQRRKITLIPDDALQAVLPRRQAILDVTTTRGRTLRHKTLDVRGTAQNPMSRDEIIAKCMDLLPPVLGKDKSRRLCDSVLNLEKLKNIQALRTLYQP